MEIVWDDEALTALNEILDFIAVDSSLNSSKIAGAVLKICDKISKHPFIYPPDKYKKNNTSAAYRAFHINRIRLSYKVEDNRILIVRCRHSSQRPLNF